MAAGRNPVLVLLFGKAFLLALEQGRRDTAMVFARAFLSLASETAFHLRPGVG